jgi:CheY-like chemotaxis protein
MSEPQPTKKKMILILDDEPHVVAYLETLLHDHGYETVSAPDGRRGMEKVKSENVDLICLDISMPEQSGIRFYRNLKEDPDLQAIPVVVVTAVTGYGGDAESFRRFLSTRKQVSPPDGFLAKPIDKREFLNLIAAVLSRSAARGENDSRSSRKEED